MTKHSGGFHKKSSKTLPSSTFRFHLCLRSVVCKLYFWHISPQTKKSLDVKPGDLGYYYPKGPINQRSEKDALNDSLTKKFEGIMKYHCRLQPFLNGNFGWKKIGIFNVPLQIQLNSIHILYHRYEHNILFKDLRFALWAVVLYEGNNILFCRLQ